MASRKFMALEYIDFPQSRLERLIAPQEAPLESALSGPSYVEARSRWTRLAMKLLPGTFFVDVKINGHKASLVVDTGAFVTILNPHLATKASVRLTQRGPKIALVGDLKQEIYIGWINDLDIDALKISNVPVVVPNQQLVLKLLGVPVWHFDGLLGMDPISKLTLALDYERQIVVFCREPVPKQAPSASLHILEEQNLVGFKGLRPLVNCFLDGSGPFSALIDTGTSASVLIPSDIWQELGLGNSNEHCIQRLQLDEIELQNVPAQVSHMKFIIIGSNIFQAQGIKRLTLDFITGKLYVER